VPWRLGRQRPVIDSQWPRRRSVPLAVGCSLERLLRTSSTAFLSTRGSVLIAAASDTGSSVEIVRALAQAGLRANGLEPAEA
jgi:hypothetical protein